MPQPPVGDFSLSDAYAILKSQAPALPYELDPRFNDPVICKRVGDLIARANDTTQSRGARVERADPRPASRFYVSKFARDLALTHLAGRDEFHLSPVVRKQLTEVVHGYTGRCDEAAARAGIEWMRDRYRVRGEATRS
jgi:hypothetical protein